MSTITKLDRMVRVWRSRRRRACRELIERTDTRGRFMWIKLNAVRKAPMFTGAEKELLFRQLLRS